MPARNKTITFLAVCTFERQTVMLTNDVIDKIIILARTNNVCKQKHVLMIDTVREMIQTKLDNNLWLISYLGWAILWFSDKREPGDYGGSHPQPGSSLWAGVCVCVSQVNNNIDCFRLLPSHSSALLFAFFFFSFFSSTFFKIIMIKQ